MRAWFPDEDGDGDGDEGPGRNVVADSAAEAAEIYAERHYSHVDHGPGPLAVRVRDETGAIFDFEVTIDWDPVFSATRKIGGAT